MKPKRGEEGDVVWSAGTGGGSGDGTAAAPRTLGPSADMIAKRQAALASTAASRGVLPAASGAPAAPLSAEEKAARLAAMAAAAASREADLRDRVDRSRAADEQEEKRDAAALAARLRR